MLEDLSIKISTLGDVKDSRLVSQRAVIKATLFHKLAPHVIYPELVDIMNKCKAAPYEGTVGEAAALICFLL